jgi:predicted Rossmann-fold nucleotide-binding protein
VPTPRPEVIAPIDHSPHEVESEQELAYHLDRRTLAGLTMQGVSLIGIDLSGVDVSGALFVGCELSNEQIETVIDGGGHVVPDFSDTPFPTQPSRLYTPDDLAEGFDVGGAATMYDAIVYKHYLEHGGAIPDLREALAQRIHDHGIDNALASEVDGWLGEHGTASIIGIMGGHAELRGSAGYREAAGLAWRLARSGRLILTGGGPGVMEAANLGAYMASRPLTELHEAIDELQTAVDFHQPQAYTAAALRVRAKYQPDPATPWERAGGLAIPTWFYGHEPANLFAARVAKLFSNAVREEQIVTLSRGGIVFAEGRAGTVQEIFQATTLTFYGIAQHSGPFLFLGKRFWTEDLPVGALLGPLLKASPLGDLSTLIHVTDDVEEAAALLTSREG